MTEQEEKQTEVKTDVAQEGATKQKPEITFRAKTLSVSLWANKQIDGGVSYSISPVRSYRDKEGNWHKTTTLFEKDLLMMSTLLQEAWRYIYRVDIKENAA